MRLEICCEDRVGIVQQVLNILVEHEINLRKIEVTPSKQRMYVAFLEVEFEKLQLVMPQIRRLAGIGDVKTVAFLPSEREHNELETLLRALPDGIITLDAKGKVLLANQSALSSLGCVAAEVTGHAIGQFLQGFDFNQWLTSEEINAKTVVLKNGNEQFVADILPLQIHEDELGDSLLGAVINLKSQARLGEQMVAFTQPEQPSFSRFICKSANMKKVLRDAGKMAHQKAPMLLTGETGTGKESLAKACHDAGKGEDKPFITINCASIPDQDIEAELFGRWLPQSGEVKPGLFEQADGGTVFIDEVVDMSPNLQGKLVRFLHCGRFRRVGDEQERAVDVRVICSTQKDLSELVQKGEFREDLYYRLNVLTLILPPLRERKQDIMPLSLHFIHQFARQQGTLIPTLDGQCEAHLKDYGWPGNIRQLENALCRAVTLLEGDKITLAHLQLPSHAKSRVVEYEITGTLDEAVKQYEAGILRELFPSFPSSRQLAKRLGLSHTAVANKLREYGISKKTMS